MNIKKMGSDEYYNYGLTNLKKLAGSIFLVRLERGYVYVTDCLCWQINGFTGERGFLLTELVPCFSY